MNLYKLVGFFEINVYNFVAKLPHEMYFSRKSSMSTWQQKCSAQRNGMNSLIIILSLARGA